MTESAVKDTHFLAPIRGWLFHFVIISSALIVSGCSLSSGLPQPKLASSDDIITGSVVKQAKPEGVAQTDADIIKSTVAAAETEASTIRPLAWSNPETGSSGAIVAIDTFMGKHGQSCRGFKTSVANFTGVSFYNGETCKVAEDRWVLSWFRPT
ncbi:MAG: RT0821/Lpp0805 family surface protein [Ahrensia sp.]|nr:RT0821/Lpp0805 family surface protein [Ahrensia sp.]